MNILVACEFSGIVREAFRKKGHEAWSCDLLSSEIPGHHLKGDVLEILNDSWDMLIAFPECKYLTNTANRSFINNPDRWEKRLEAAIFVKKLLDYPIKKICLENPPGAISTWIRKPDQYIQPCEHGHPETKKTGLWLKNLDPLKPTNKVNPEYIYDSNGERYSPTHWNNPSTNNPENAKLRARTYQGIADAMAEQWG